jgi:hypothetical protein
MKLFQLPFSPPIIACIALLSSCGTEDDSATSSTTPGAGAAEFSYCDLVVGETQPGSQGLWNLSVVPDFPGGPPATGVMTFNIPEISSLSSSDCGDDVQLSSLAINGFPDILDLPGVSVVWDLSPTGLFTAEIVFPIDNTGVNTVWTMSGQMTSEKVLVAGFGDVEVVDAATGLSFFYSPGTFSLTLVE